jgi:hypothetical protein
VPALEAHGEQGKGETARWRTSRAAPATLQGRRSAARQTRRRTNRRTRQTSPLSALPPAGSVPEADFSPGVRAALDQIFPAEQSRLGRVAERSAIYGAGATDGAGAGLEALADRYGVTLALRADNDREHAPDQGHSFAERVRMAPSLTEEQRRHWLALLAANPA